MAYVFPLRSDPSNHLTYFLASLTRWTSQISRVQTYDYHPPLPPADPESPDAPLGDCAICMDAILAEHRRTRSSEHDRDKEREGLLGLTSSGLLEKVGVGRARRSYSLAPCGHLFVSRSGWHSVEPLD